MLKCKYFFNGFNKMLSTNVSTNNTISWILREYSLFSIVNPFKKSFSLIVYNAWFNMNIRSQIIFKIYSSTYNTRIKVKIL